MKVESKYFALAVGTVFYSLGNIAIEASNIIPTQLCSMNNDNNIMIKSNTQPIEISITKLEDNAIVEDQFNGPLTLTFSNDQYKELEGATAWPVDIGRQQLHSGTYPFKLYSFTNDNIHIHNSDAAINIDIDVDVDVDVDKPYLFSSINWLMNKYPSGSTIQNNQDFQYLCNKNEHIITDEEFQLAVSMVIDEYDNVFENWLNNADICVVEYLVSHAERNEDYKVDCNGKNAKMSVFLVEEDPEINEKQVLVAMLDVKSVCNCTPDKLLGNIPSASPITPERLYNMPTASPIISSAIFNMPTASPIVMAPKPGVSIKDEVTNLTVNLSKKITND